MTHQHYYAGSQRIAERENGSLRWLLGNHLGSTAYTINGTTKAGKVRYLPFGANRYTNTTTDSRQQRILHGVGHLAWQPGSLVPCKPGCPRTNPLLS